MPKRARLDVPPGDETPGRLRRERGKVRPSAKMILRFVSALGASTGDLLQPATGSKPQCKPRRRVLHRLERKSIASTRRQEFAQ